MIALLSLLLVTVGCGGDEPGDASATPSGKASSSPTGADDAAPGEPKPILLGTQRYVSPCRLLDGDDLIAVYGSPGPYATFEQELVERSLSVAQMAEIDKTVAGQVTTSCRYRLDNRADSAIDLRVAQYSSPQRAQRAWKGIRRLGTGLESKELEGKAGWEWLLELARENERNQGGSQVPGLDPTVLYVNGAGEFTGVRGNLLLSLSRKDYNVRNPFEPRRVKGALRTTKEAFARIYAHADEGAPDQTPVPAYWEQRAGWPEFVDPCRALDDTAMLATAGRGSDEVESFSVVRDPDTRLKRNSQPSYKAVYNDCNRSGKLRRNPRAAFSTHDFWHAQLEIWYVAPGDTGTELLRGWVMRKLFKGKKTKYVFEDLVTEKALTKTDIPGGDLAYVFEYGKGRERFSWIVVNAGGYVFFLDGSRPNLRTKSTYDNLDSTPAQLTAGAERVLANIEAATQEG